MSEPTDRFVLDSNIVSRIVRRDARVILRLAAAIRANAEIYLCPVVYYEVRRGLLDRSAVRQLQEFDRLADALLWVDLERSMWERAAEMWVACRRCGRPHDDDADLLIAAYTSHLRAVLVTNNTNDFLDLEVPLVDWLA